MFENIADSMKYELVVHPEKGIWLLHDKPLKDILKWVDYDADRQSLTLCFGQGKIQDIGFPVPFHQEEIFLETEEISVMYMIDGKMHDMAVVPLIRRKIDETQYYHA